MIPADGIYETRSHTEKFFRDRDVYIQDGKVRLVSDANNFVFSYRSFFDVNTLGSKRQELPDGFDIRTTK